MALFHSEEERKRRENLKIQEDKRLRFVELCERKNFRPERMLFVSREDGSFAAIARHEGKLALIDAPRLGEEGEYSLDFLDAPACEREEVFEAGTGMNGMFGFGTKAAKGFNLRITPESGLPALLPVIAGRNSWLEATLRKNPLLKPRRRRGDANVVWDLLPIDSGSVRRIETLLDEYYLK